ncbi:MULTISPECIES: MFS transporter [Hymenobacter]|uniref:MFS transporter n=1 Tax=Hymenobacter armeniacus TaxID=2771358 RepID=A0ABR8JVU1_9BACT|nr:MULTISPECIES: MFS transporter [Hymenobacter]MBD2723026.1 MFS transporter [Hymenobacter armeniacus]MBJ6109081.1 MFS transporter [Hymenobacter sp. BT523]
MISLTASARPISRKAHRVAVGALFFLLGLCFATWASRIPSVQQRMGISEAALGGVLLAIPLGQLLSLPFTGWLVAREGSRKVVLWGVVLYAAALLGLGWASSLYQLVPCLVLFGVGGNLTNISVNTQAVGVERLYKHKPIMASFHGLWSLAGFVAAAIGSFMIGHAVVPGLHFIFIALFILAGLAVSAGYTVRQDSGVDPDQPIFVKPDKELLGLGAIAFCALICEGAMFDWSGVYFKKVIQADKDWVGAGYTAFMSTMALGRFGADWLAHRLGPKRVIQLCGLLTASGLLIAVLLPMLPTALLGFLLVGFGTSAVVPLVYSAAGKSTHMSAGMALASVSTIGFFGFLLGPPVIGMVAGATSLRVSFALIALMGLCVSAVAGRVRV